MHRCTTEVSRRHTWIRALLYTCFVAQQETANTLTRLSRSPFERVPSVRTTTASGFSLHIMALISNGITFRTIRCAEINNIRVCVEVSERLCLLFNLNKVLFNQTEAFSNKQMPNVLCNYENDERCCVIDHTYYASYYEISFIYHVLFNFGKGATLVIC